VKSMGHFLMNYCQSIAKWCWQHSNWLLKFYCEFTLWSCL